MTLHTEHNMQQIATPGDLPPEGWYHVRVAKVEEAQSKQGQPIVNLQLKIQSGGDGNQVGRVLFDNCSLQPHALFKLKAYYAKANYNPGQEGHDPEKLLDCEFYVFAEKDIYEGQERRKIAPWSIRSVQEGAGTVRQARSA